MNTKTLYNFTIYFRHPNLLGAGPLFSGTSSAAPHWDTAVTVMASSSEDAMEKVGEGYEGMSVIKVEHSSLHLNNEAA